ncbi:organ-specific protein, partial [Clostridium perfringens]|nr:organ-specific protein [Clostridium perfringens]
RKEPGEFWTKVANDHAMHKATNVEEEITIQSEVKSSNSIPIIYQYKSFVKNVEPSNMIPIIYQDKSLVKGLEPSNMIPIIYQDKSLVKDLEPSNPIPM